MGSDKEREAVLHEQVPGDVRTEVTSSASEGVGPTSQVWLGVAPQKVQHLVIGGMNVLATCFVVVCSLLFYKLMYEMVNQWISV